MHALGWKKTALRVPTLVFLFSQGFWPLGTDSVNKLFIIILLIYIAEDFKTFKIKGVGNVSNGTKYRKKWDTEQCLNLFYLKSYVK